MRYLNIIGEIDEKLIKESLNTIFKWEQEDLEIENDNKKLVNKDDYKKFEDITINITTNGGYTYGFNAIYNALSNLKGKIITRAYGECLSCGLWLFLMGEERVAGEGTIFLYHQMSYGKRYSDIAHHLEYANFNYEEQKRLDKFIIDRTNITKEMLDSYSTKDWFFDYNKAKELGIVK